MNEEKQELVIQENSIAQSNSFDVLDVDGAVDYFHKYQELTTKLLSPSDYQSAGRDKQGNPRKFKKKSAWRKYATAFNLSDEIVDEDIVRDKDGQIISAKYIVKATAPNGRSGLGIGVCSIFDKQKKETDTKFEMRQRFSNVEHDVPSTAHTRAKNRAISDIIGAGEVSAEEMSFDNSKESNSNGGVKNKIVRNGKSQVNKPNKIIDTTSKDVKSDKDMSNNFVNGNEAKTTKTKIPLDNNLTDKQLITISKKDKHLKDVVDTLAADAQFENVNPTKKDLLREINNIHGDGDITVAEKKELDEFVAKF